MTSKEMLESWYKVLLYIDWENKNNNEETNNEYKVILQDLDRLEKLENNIDKLKIENIDLKLRNKELEKAIKFFKEKMNIRVSKHSELGYVVYEKGKNNSYLQVLYHFREEEIFNLLKEVFEDGK